MECDLLAGQFLESSQCTLSIFVIICLAWVILKSVFIRYPRKEENNILYIFAH
jgi:hypothetical protein